MGSHGGVVSSSYPSGRWGTVRKGPPFGRGPGCQESYPHNAGLSPWEAGPRAGQRRVSLHLEISDLYLCLSWHPTSGLEGPRPQPRWYLSPVAIPGDALFVRNEEALLLPSAAPDWHRPEVAPCCAGMASFCQQRLGLLCFKPLQQKLTLLPAAPVSTGGVHVHRPPEPRLLLPQARPQTLICP